MSHDPRASKSEATDSASSNAASSSSVSRDLASSKDSSAEDGTSRRHSGRSTGDRWTVPMDNSKVFAALIRFLRWAVENYFRRLHRVRIEGLENIPSHGAAILAPNHQSFYDGPLVGFGIDRPIYTMVLASYCKAPVLGRILRKLRAIPVAGPRDRSAYAKVLQVLEKDQLAVVFPEGNRSRDGDLMRLQAGAVRAALTLGVDIVPVSLLGVYDAWPRHRRLPRWFKPIVVRYHPPIPCPRVERDQLKGRIDEVMATLEGVLKRPMEAWREETPDGQNPGR